MKRIIIGKEKLPEEVRQSFELNYKNGSLQPVTQLKLPNDQLIFVVPFPTDGINYLVKVNAREQSTVKSDDELDDIFEKISKIPDDMV